MGNELFGANMAILAFVDQKVDPKIDTVGKVDTRFLTILGGKKCRLLYFFKDVLESFGNNLSIVFGPQGYFWLYFYF